MNIQQPAINGGGPGSTGIDYAHLIQNDRIHASLYTDPAIFQEEMERVFYRSWVFVGHESEIPNPGDYVRRTIGLEQVVLLRNRQGEARVLSNRCIHRGNMICSHERGHAGNFTLKCDYHGWTYSLDGNLVGVPYPGGFKKDKSSLGLRRPARVESYRGFVFATFNPESVTLEQHLGRGKELIDRAVGMSPVQRLRLDAGWVKQHFTANWKMLPENETDGYHVNFVHASFARAINSQYDAATMVSEKELVSETKDWGGGHTELYFSPTYRKPFEWFGVNPDRVADYTAQMVAAYGQERAEQILLKGPPHAVIFPNLFLGEMNIVMFQPISANECVQWHTPMLLEGVPDSFNQRIIRQSEAALGPSAFLLADDGVISERQQIAMQANGGWLDLSRGLNRERTEDGIVLGHITDETTNRGFWKHYRKIMTASGDAA